MSAIHVFGDSHAQFSTTQLTNVLNGEILGYHLHSRHSTTMHRIGRDKVLLPIPPNTIDKHRDVVLITYGEIDCRSHIDIQIREKGRVLDEVVDTLARGFCETIRSYGYAKVVVLAVIPPVRRHDYESRWGEITHGVPFRGGDAERLLYTDMLNIKLKTYCDRHGFHFVDPYRPHYTIQESGMLDFSKSDGVIHVGDSTEICRVLAPVIKKLIS